MSFGKKGGGGGGGGGGGYRDFGLLLLRIGIGLSFVVVHGFPKMWGGPKVWHDLGATMQIFGVTWQPTFWGFMAAFAEFGGGIFIILGLFFRPFCALMTIQMIVASCSHLIGHVGLPKDATTMQSIMVASHALELGVLFLSLVFIGPGKFSLGRHVPGPTIRLEKESE